MLNILKVISGAVNGVTQYANGGSMQGNENTNGFIPIDLEEKLRLLAKWGGIKINEVIGVLNAMIDTGIEDDDLMPTPTKDTQFQKERAIEKKIDEIWNRVKPNYKGSLIGNRHYSMLKELIGRRFVYENLLQNYKPFRKFQKFEEGGELNELLSVFNELKKGDVIRINFDSGITKGSQADLKVVSKNMIGKGKSWQSEKITFININNPSGVRYFAFKRANNHVGFAWGDMAIWNVKVKKEFQNGGEVGIYNKFDNTILQRWRNYGGSTISVLKELQQLKKMGKAYYGNELVVYDDLVNSLSENDKKILSEIEKHWNWKLAKGGEVERYVLSFNYNPSGVKNEYAESIVSKYTNDWKRNNDWDEVSFYVQGLTKQKAYDLKDELKMEDIYNIEIEKSAYKYANGGDLGINFNIVYEKPNSNIAYTETINANSLKEAKDKFYAKHPTCTILHLSEEYAKGGGVGDSFLHLYKLTYPDGFYIVESYDGEYMSPKEAMEKMKIRPRYFKSYKYRGVSSQNPKYKEWYNKKDIGYSNTEAWDEVFENEEYAKGGGVKISRSQKQYNKEVDAYKWFVVDTENKKAVSGWEYKADALEALSDYDGDNRYKVMAEVSLAKNGIGNPKDNWKKMEQGGKVNGYTDYYLVVNIDERGLYSADVRNPLDEVVFSIGSAEEMQELIVDGFLKYKADEDLNRLTKYLMNQGIIPNGSQIYSEDEFESDVRQNYENDNDLLEFVIPTWALPSLINADDSGLNEDDIEKLDKFVKKVVEDYGNANFMLGSESDESYFSHRNDIDSLGSDVTKLYLKPTREYANGGGLPHNTKVVAFPEHTDFKYYVIGETDDKYIVVNEEKVEHWKNANVTDRYQYFEEELPKVDVIVVGEQKGIFAQGGRVNESVELKNTTNEYGEKYEVYVNGILQGFISGSDGKYFVMSASAKGGKAYNSKFFDSIEKCKKYVFSKCKNIYPIGSVKKIMGYAQGGSVSDDTPKVWVGEWSLYNEGKLMGQWIDLSDFDSGAEVMEKISELMNDLTEKTGELREEYAVFDYENFPRSMYSEQMGEKEFDNVIEAYKISQERDMPIDVIGDIMREYSPDDIESFIDENYEGYFESEEDLAYHVIDATGGIENMSKDTLERYFDYESFGRDLSINDYTEFDGHYFRIYKRGGQLKSDYKKHIKKHEEGGQVITESGLYAGKIDFMRGGEINKHLSDFRADFTIEWNVKKIGGNLSEKQWRQEYQTGAFTNKYALECFDELKKIIKSQKWSIDDWSFAGRSNGWFVLVCSGNAEDITDNQMAKMNVIVRKYMKNYANAIGKFYK